MSVGRGVWIRCDGCDTWIPADLSCSTVAEAREEARMDGWKRRKGRDLCPDCLAAESAPSPEAD